MTFLALFLSSIKYDIDKPKRRFCGYKFNKVYYFENEYVDYAATMNIILANRKLVDDYNDDKNILSLIGSKIIKLDNQQRYKQK